MPEERTVKRTYVGIHDSVNLIELGRTVEYGETIDVPKSFADRLDEQPDNWATPGDAKSKAAKKTAAKKTTAKKTAAKKTTSPEQAPDVTDDNYALAQAMLPGHRGAPPDEAPTGSLPTEQEH